MCILRGEWIKRRFSSRASVSDTLINTYVIDDVVKRGGGVNYEFLILLSVNP